MRVEDAEYLVFRVRRVKPHGDRDEKESVFLDSGMSAFTADAGVYEEGDRVVVTNDEERRAVGKLRVDD